MPDEVRDAIEAELCTCLHKKADHHGAFGDGRCGVTILASPTFAGHCSCDKFTWKCFVWKDGMTPKVAS